MGILDSMMTPVSQAKDPLAEREKWLNMSQLFNSFTMNPQNSQGYYEGQQKGIDRQRDAISLKAKTDLGATEFLIAKGGEYAVIGNALANQQISSKDAMEMYKSLAGKSPTETFKTITGDDALAMGLDPERSYNVSNLTKKITGIGAGGTTIINEATAPDQGELYKVLAKNEAEQWGGFLKAGSTAATVIPDLNTLGELLNQAPNGPVQGRLAQNFSGFNTAADAAKALISRMAPSMRVEGSGSSSDIDVKMLMDALGSLVNDPAANALIHQAFKAKLNLDIQRQSIVRKVQSKTLTANEGRAELEKLDQVSILPDALRGMIGTNAATAISAGGIPAGISKAKWDSLTQSQKDSISALFAQ